MSELLFDAARADARRHGQPSVLTVGQTVRITRGPYAGKSGTVKDVVGFKLLISVDEGNVLVSRLSVDAVVQA